MHVTKIFCTLVLEQGELQMRVEQLNYIYEIISAGSLRSAAERLHTTQQNLSAYVANLEKEIGIKIFERSPEGMKLTKDGEKLLPLFNELSDTYERILNAGIKQGVVSMKKGKLRFACNFTIARFITSDVMVKFYEMFPNVDLTLIEVYTDDLNEIVASENDLDIVLFPIDQSRLSALSSPDDYTVRTVAKDSLVLVCGKDSPLANRKKVSVSSLVDHPYVAFFTAAPEDTWTYQKVFAEHNVHPNRITQCNIESLYLKMISTGSFSISTRLTARHTDFFKPYQIVSIPFREDESFYYAIAARHNDKECAMYFANLVEKTLQRFLD